MQILGIWEAGVLFAYLVPSFLLFAVAIVLIAYHKFTVNCEIVESENVTSCVRIWKPKEGLITIGDRTWDVSKVKPIAHKGRFGYEPKYILPAWDASPLEFSVERDNDGKIVKGEVSFNPLAPVELKKLIEQKIAEKLMHPPSDFKDQIIFVALGFVAGGGLAYGLSASGALG